MTETAKKSAGDFTCSEHPRDGNYEVPASCANCGWEGITRWTTGHATHRGARCPGCDCRYVLNFTPGRRLTTSEDKG